MKVLNFGPRQLTLRAAAQSGYVVETPTMHGPEGTLVLFAGELDACVFYIGDNIAKHVEPAES